MIKKGKIYISKQEKISEFTLFAKVIDVYDGQVVIDRRTKFGFVHNGQITLSEKDFLKYYQACDLVTGEILTYIRKQYEANKEDLKVAKQTLKDEGLIQIYKVNETFEQGFNNALEMVLDRYK